MDWEKLRAELEFRTSRSSGAGGQHVNKTETKVEALLDVKASPGLNEDEKKLVFEKAINRINDEGILSITSQKSRSQLDNKENAIEKLQQILLKALTPVTKRIRTKPSKSSVEERLEEKKIQAEKKEGRKKPTTD
ncbi:MAG: aminoacyl-tRNA hydrolase [Saprospiraceae bacterium]|uniref:Aminoacyl-tRNA hydrolase n=1 Tax=Candidatus Opimibacter skivensis TaxID=2982028 RepID=A0A9D7SS52_9BACT|nr:aminoacyl-tRNA hydrolase [Candidatus Opimibacter skivensis]